MDLDLSLFGFHILLPCPASIAYKRFLVLFIVNSSKQFVVRRTLELILAGSTLVICLQFCLFASTAILMQTVLPTHLRSGSFLAVL